MQCNPFLTNDIDFVDNSFFLFFLLLSKLKKIQMNVFLLNININFRNFIKFTCLMIKYLLLTIVFQN